MGAVHTYSLPVSSFLVKFCFRLDIVEDVHQVRAALIVLDESVHPLQSLEYQDDNENCDRETDDDFHTLILHVEKPRCQPEEDLG